MAKSEITIYFVLLLLPFYVFADTIKSPELEPALTNQHEQVIIDEGTALHDQGKYDEAVGKFKQVLEKSPSNVLALYEMASSYFSAKKYDEALKASYEGIRYKSKYLPKFYLFIGNSLDELGNTDEAITAFQEALAVVSNDPMIHFNLGVILVNSGKLAEAQPYLEKAIELNPTHSSSHYALSQIYFHQEKKIPGILATLRYLTLDPDSKRSGRALAILDKNLGMIEDSKKTEMEQKITLLNDLLKSLSKTNQDKFVADQYLPYFVELQKNNLVTPFINYIYQGTNREAAAWVEKNSSEIQRFQKWSSNFAE